MYSNKQNIYGNNSNNNNYKAGEKYVPRKYHTGTNQSFGSSIGSSTGAYMFKKPVLDINSVANFPSLGSLVKNSQGNSRNGIYNNNNFVDALSHPVETVAIKSYPWDLPIPDYDVPVKDGYVIIKRKNGVADFTFGESKFTKNDKQHTMGLLNGSFADTLMDYRLDCYQNERYSDMNMLGTSSIYYGQPTIKESIGFLHEVDRKNEIIQRRRESEDSELSSNSDCEIITVEPEAVKEFIIG